MQHFFYYFPVGNCGIINVVIPKIYWTKTHGVKKNEVKNTIDVISVLEVWYGLVGGSLSTGEDRVPSTGAASPPSTAQYSPLK